MLLHVKYRFIVGFKIMTHGHYYSFYINNLNDVYENNQIDHNLQKLGHFLTFQKSEDQSEQSLKNWNQ